MNKITKVRWGGGAGELVGIVEVVNCNETAHYIRLVEYGGFDPEADAIHVAQYGGKINLDINTLVSLEVLPNPIIF
jgi:hypothetical protein